MTLYTDPNFQVQIIACGQVKHKPTNIPNETPTEEDARVEMGVTNESLNDGLKA